MPTTKAGTQKLTDEERDTLASHFYGKSWDHLDTKQRRVCSGHGGSAHRMGMDVNEWCSTHQPGATSAKKK